MFGNFNPHDKVIDSVVDALRSGNYNGYGPSVGHKQAREAVARYSSREGAHVEAGVILLMLLMYSTDNVINFVILPFNRSFITTKGVPRGSGGKASSCPSSSFK